MFGYEYQKIYPTNTKKELALCTLLLICILASLATYLDIPPNILITLQMDMNAIVQVPECISGLSFAYGS